MIENLILDYNGVVSDDFSLVHRTSMRLFQIYGLNPNLTVEEFRNMFEIPASRFWEKMLPGVDFDLLNKRYFEIYSEWGSPNIYPQAKETLTSLSSLGVNLVILSSHLEEKIRAELEGFGIDSCMFTKIYGGVNNKLDVIEQVLRESDFSQETTAYVGDTEHDVETGKKVGVRTIASTYGYRTREQLAKVNPDIFIDTPEGLLEAVKV